jgi:hypothetical protein
MMLIAFRFNFIFRFPVFYGEFYVGCFLYYLDKRNFSIKLFSRLIYIQFHSGTAR